MNNRDSKITAEGIDIKKSYSESDHTNSKDNLAGEAPYQ